MDVDRRIISFKGIKELGVPYCRTQVGRKQVDGSFPKSFKLDEHRGSPRVWWRREIKEWLDARARAR